MKFKIFSFLIASSLVLVDCKKEQNSTENESNTMENTTSLEQKPQTLKSDSGEEITMVYYAEGTDVAIKMTKNNQEHKLLAKGTDDKGNPIFSNEEYAWILGEDGHEGFLLDKSGNKIKFK